MAGKICTVREPPKRPPPRPIARPSNKHWRPPPVSLERLGRLLCVPSIMSPRRRGTTTTPAGPRRNGPHTRKPSFNSLRFVSKPLSARQNLSRRRASSSSRIVSDLERRPSQPWRRCIRLASRNLANERESFGSGLSVFRSARPLEPNEERGLSIGAAAAACSGHFISGRLIIRSRTGGQSGVCLLSSLRASSREDDTPKRRHDPSGCRSVSRTCQRRIRRPGLLF